MASSASGVQKTNGIALLHLSDLHFGQHNRFKDRDLAEFGRSFGREVRATVEKQSWDGPKDEPLDLIIVSGDITEMAKPSEFKQGHQFLTAVAEELGFGKNKERVVFIPGNHDVSWAQCQIVDAMRAAEEISEDEYPDLLNKHKFKPYNDFLKTFYGWPDGTMPTTLYPVLHLPSGSYLRNFDFSNGRNELTVSVACLNSSETESNKKQGGELTKEQAEALIKIWMEPRYQGYLKILIVHHNPLATPAENRDWTLDYYNQQLNTDKLTEKPHWLKHYSADMVGFKGSEHLKRIVHDTNAHLVLHGHHHTPTSPDLWKRQQGGASPILSVGSFGLKDDQIPLEQPLTCQLIRFSQVPEPRIIALPLRFNARYRQTGSLDMGQYHLDAYSESGYDDSFYLPPDWQQKVEDEANLENKIALPELESQINQFAHECRIRYKNLYTSYDLKNLGVSQSEIHNVAPSRLDDLYLPLRFAREFDMNLTDKGETLNVDDLWNQLTKISLTGQNIRQRNIALSLTGIAGAGKTTWMRYTFRRLAEDPRFLPFFIELRHVAVFWRNGELSRRSIEAYLEEWLLENVPSFRDSGVNIFQLLKSQSSWFPILMVDGWDELGELGNEFREKLTGLMAAFPRILVVTTSRPYGNSRPTYSEGFEQLQLQPLSPDEISAFTLKFYTKCYTDEIALVNQQVATFQTALQRSDDAQLLAKTPLLLTMLLFINRSDRLPDKRHQLYEKCLGSLLSVLPEMQKEKGVQDGVGEWCPPPETRFQIVALLAYDLQTKHDQIAVNGTTTPIVVPRRVLLDYLPEVWELDKKKSFLLWLCNRAGVMVEDIHNNVYFAHLSFQEFLTAWHLNNNYVGDQALAPFFLRAKNPHWWETLILWMALLNSQSLSRAQELLEQVIAQMPILGSMIIADGIGSSTQTEDSALSLCQLLVEEWPEQLDRCLRAWAASLQEERRNTLCEKLRRTAETADWLAWLRFVDALDKIGDHNGIDINRPLHLKQTPILAFVSDKTIYTAEEFAGSNAMSGIHLDWPSSPHNLLHLWPSRRRQLALRLQRLAVIKTPTCVLVDYLKIMVEEIVQLERKEYADGLALALALDFTLDRAFNRALDRARVHARAHVLGHNVTHDPDHAHSRARALALDLSLARARARARALDLALAVDLNLDLALDSSNGYSRAHTLARRFSLDRATIGDQHLFEEEMERCFFDHLLMRVSFSYFEPVEIDEIESTLIPLALQIAASRASVLGREHLFHKDVLLKTIDAAKKRHCDGLWIALARHIARISMPDDISFLEMAAAHPENYEPPLSWGLQFMVRGDIVMTDEEDKEKTKIVTFDQLCIDAGIDPEQFPLLESMPL